jgi:NADPH2:quinone reductase
MRAVVCEDLDGLDGLVLREMPDPVAGPGQVVVDVHAASVESVDTLIATGRYQLKVPVPFVPGNNLAGVVSAIGPGVNRFQLGDRVHGMAFVGAFAERVALAEAQLRPTPDGLSAEAACLTGTTYRTAYDALVSTARVATGDDVVILGAAGAVGSAAATIAKFLGARVISCASSDAKLDFCRSLGADEVIGYTDPGFKEALKSKCKASGADVVLDMVGGDLSEAALRAIGYGGRYVVIGFASGTIPKIPLNLVLLKGSTIKGYEIASFERRDSEAAATNRAALESMLATGGLTPPIRGRYPIDEAVTAMKVVSGRDKVGMTVITRQN